MYKSITGAFVAAACILLTAIPGANARDYREQFEWSKNIFQSSIENALKEGQVTSLSEVWHVDGDIFSIGTDEFTHPLALDSSYNTDSTDPFFYSPVPQTPYLIGYQTWPQAPMLQGATSGSMWSGAPSLQGATNGTMWSGAQAARRQIPWLQGATNGTIGPQGVDAFYVTGVNTAGRVHHTSTWKNNPNQPRWEINRLPLRVYISGTVEAARGGLVRDTIKSALAQWARASNGVIRYQITNRFTESDICFVEQLTDNHEWAQTCVDYHKGPIDRVKVIMLSSTLGKLEEPRLKGLCLHEIGHAFGILKHSSNGRDAMSEMATDDNHPVVILSQTDKQRMAALYARTPITIWEPIPIANARLH